MDLERFFSQIRQVKNFICLTFALVMSPKPTLDTHHHHSVFWRGKKVQMSTTWKKRERGKKFFRETNLLVLLQSPMSVTAQWSTIDRVSQNLVSPLHVAAATPPLILGGDDPFGSKHGLTILTHKSFATAPSYEDELPKTTTWLA